MKILYFFCGEGLGHTTRTIAAAKELSKKHKVTLASYGYAKEFAKKSGLKVIEVPSEISLSGKAGALDIKNSVIATIKKTKGNELFVYDSIIRKEKPDLVISDSFYSPALLAHLRKVTVWMILNQLNVKSFFQGKGVFLKLTGLTVNKFNMTSLSYMNKLLIPDFSPPNTICLKNLKGADKSIMNKLEFIGPLVRKDSENKYSKNKKIIYVSIGGFGYRKKMLVKILNVAKEMPNYKFNIICGPNAKINSTSKNVTCFKEVTNPLELMAKSSMVICGGGHSTIIEAASMGKKIISMPDIAHSEQEANASQLKKLRIGEKISYNTSERKIKNIIKKLSSSKNKKKSIELIELFEKQNGKKNLLRMANELEEVMKIS